MGQIERSRQIVGRAIHAVLIAGLLLTAPVVSVAPSDRVGASLTTQVEEGHRRIRAQSTVATLQGSKPGPPLQVEVVPEWRSSGSVYPIRILVTPGVDTDSVRCRLTGTGTFAGVDETRNLPGPWRSGDITELVIEVPVPTEGEGSLQASVSLIDGAGNISHSRRSDYFVFIEDDELWASASSPTDLRFWRLEQLLISGDLSSAELLEGIDAIVGASGVTDTVPRPSVPLTQGQRRLQQTFEQLAPSGQVDRDFVEAVTAKAVTLTVKGQVEWTDRNGGTHGLPMATVEIRDSDLIGSELIETVMTDVAGKYSATFTHDDGIGQGNPDIFVRVLARSVVADLKPDTVLASTYFMDSAVQGEVATGSTVTLNLTSGNGADNETVFSLHHALVVIGGYAGGLAGTMPSQVDTRFPTTRHTSLFSGTQLHILQLDRWDWDVIHHEYGHYFQSIHGFENNPGGAHDSADNLSSTRGSKDLGTRLAWGEGWPTFFGISGQALTSTASLGVPNAGDVTYQDTEDINFSLNLETRNGVGEDNEASVMAALWDLFDDAADGVDEVSLSDKLLFTTFKGAAVTTMGAAWEALAATQTTQGKTLVGGVLGQSNISPVLTAPADNVEVSASDPIPTFTWTRNGGGTPNPLNDFRIRFYRSDFGAIVFEKELGDTVTFTPTTAEWATIAAGDTIVKWVIEGKNTSAPATPGGALDRYWSRSRSIGGIKIVFVIDDTGSMREEIGGVRTALQAYIDLVVAKLPLDADPPTIQLITFKDNVTTRITSNDLTAVRSVVGALVASGGGDCPEFSAQALQVASQNIAPGGTILLATDASSQPGVDVGAVTTGLRAKGVTVNTILSGDCTGITSRAFSRATSLDKDANQVAPSGSQTSGLLEKPGDEDPPQGPISDPGQPVLDEHGDAAETATFLLVNNLSVRGVIGISPDTLDFFRFQLEAGKAYAVRFRLESGSSVVFSLIGPDGTSILTSRTAFNTLPQTIAFTPLVDGDYFLRASRSGSSVGSAYLVSVARDAFASLTSAVEVFSTVSAQTGGAFFIRDDVNFGNIEAYVAALFNVMASTLEPAVLSSNPDRVPQGTTLSLSLIGRGTNWRTGTTVDFPDGGIDVLSVSVASATALSALISVDPVALMGFRQVVVETPLGGEVEQAFGIDVVQVVPAVVSPTLLSVEPSDISQGDVRILFIRGVNTLWDGTSVVTLGAGVTVSSTNVLSSGIVEVTATVEEAAAIGFRTATVTTVGAGTEAKIRALFINSGDLALPEIVSADPAVGEQGQTLVVAIVGLNTSFESGLTSALLGDGISVVSVDVVDSLNATLEIDIDADATLGFRNVSLTTGGEVAVLLNGFFVSEASGSAGTPIKGLRLLMRERSPSRKSMMVTSIDERIFVPPLGSGADPTEIGATLEVINPITGEGEIFLLPAGNWTGIGRPGGALGYRYRDRFQRNGPCRNVTIINRRSLRARCRGDQISFTLNEAQQETLSVTLRIGTELAYCMEFGGRVLRDIGTPAGRRGTGMFAAFNAPAPIACRASE